jgi:hypothetical protein
MAAELLHEQARPERAEVGRVRQRGRRTQQRLELAYLQL